MADTKFWLGSENEQPEVERISRLAWLNISRYTTGDATDVYDTQEEAEHFSHGLEWRIAVPVRIEEVADGE